MKQLKLDEFMWSQKYRPQTVEDIILPSRIKADFLAFKEHGNIPDLLLAGPAGTGKTTAAKALCNDLGIEYLFLQGSGEDRGIDAVKHKIPRFAQSVSWDNADKRKMVIYDEADNLTADAQLALRTMIEANSDNCGFMLTCNYPERFIEPLLSRFGDVVDFKIPKAEANDLALQFLKRLVFILKNEGITDIDGNVLKTLVMRSFPDMRKIINALQRYSSTGKIDSGILELIKKEDLTELYRYLKAKEWSNMRNWVGSEVEDHLGVVLDMFKNGSKYFKIETFPQAIIHLNNAQNEMVMAPNKELVLASALTLIMFECEFE